MTKIHRTPKVLKPFSTRPDFDNSWWFSDNIENWIKSKVNDKRKKDKETKQLNKIN